MRKIPPGDATMRGRDFGVWKVWADLVTHGRSWTIAEPPGMGVWEKPPAHPRAPLLEALFAAPNELQARVLEYYSQRNADLQAMIARQRHDPVRPDGKRDGHPDFLDERRPLRGGELHRRAHRPRRMEIAVPLPTTTQVNGIRIDFTAP